MSPPRQLLEWVIVPRFILMGQSNNLTPQDRVVVTGALFQGGLGNNMNPADSLGSVQSGGKAPRSRW